MNSPHPRLVVLLDKDGATARALGLLIQDWDYDCIHGASLSAVLVGIHDRLHEIAAIITEENLLGGTGEAAVDEARTRGIAAPALLLVRGELGPLRRTQTGKDMVRRMQKPVAPERVRAWLDSVVAHNER